MIIDGKPLEGKDGAELDWAIFLIIREMIRVAAAKGDVVSAMHQAGDCSRSGSSIIRIRRYRTCSHFTGMRNL